MSATTKTEEKETSPTTETRVCITYEDGSSTIDCPRCGSALTDDGEGLAFTSHGPWAGCVRCGWSASVGDRGIDSMELVEVVVGPTEGTTADGQHWTTGGDA